ncbi:MAG: hypothetical protein ACRCSQ_03575 [Bacteroidales bacterium]
MKRFIDRYTVSDLLKYLCFFICFMMISCDDDFQMNLPLNVNSNELELAEAGGSTQVMVYATGKWTVEFETPVKWGSLDRLEGEGNSHFVFSFSQNFGAARKVNILLRKGEHSQVVSFTQAGLTPSMKFRKQEASLVKNKLQVVLPLSTNLKYNLDEIKLGVTYDDELSQEWMSEVLLTDSAVYFMALPNETGENRKARLSLDFEDGKGDKYATFVDVTQTTETPQLAFESPSVEFNKLGGQMLIPMLTNLQDCYSNITGAIMPVGGNVSGMFNIIAPSGDNLILDVNVNETGADRVAKIILTFTDADNNSYPFELTVKQTPLAYESITFETLRSLIPAAEGTLVIDQPFMIEGTVISDKDNPNIENNPNLTATSIDFSENGRTAYMQANDGSYGMRIKTTTPEENQFVRYSKANIVLTGLTLVKEANPERYTLTEVTPAAILSVTPGTPSSLSRKVRKINELTDADLYTFVSLQDIEFALSDGSYSNVNDGYQLQTDWNVKGTTAPRLDCAITSLRDKEGGSLYMLINGNVPWRRNGSGVPQGAGTFNGVLVHSKQLRYGAGEGNIGRYSIRPLLESDIEIDRSESSRFSSTLVEWNWNKGVLNGDKTTGVTPDICNDANKTATIRHSAGIAGALTNDFNDVSNDGSGKGSLSNRGFLYSSKWWDFANNEGEAFVVSFTTAGISGGNLNVCFSIGSGSGSAATCNAPLYWQVEYSVNGTDFSAVPGSEFYVKPLVWWSNTALFCNPGNTDYSFRLPDVLFNQSNVTLKLKAKYDICATATQPEGGKITAASPNVSVRLGALSIKYNK